MKTPKSQQGFAHIILVVLVLVAIGGVGFYVLNSSKTLKTQPLKVTGNGTTKKVAHPGIIQSEVFAASVDAKGAPVQPTKTFDGSTPKIYAVLALNGAKSTQRLEYTRYLNGKFVDNGSIPVSKDNPQYASITFVLKPGKTHPKGSYTVKSYTNGVFEKSAKYTVR